jgi:methyltransferase
MDSLIESIAGWFFLATILERLTELVVSRRNKAWSLKQGGVEYGVEHYKMMVGMHSLFFVAILVEFLWCGSDLPPQIRLVAVVVGTICQLLRVWIIQTLGPQWNTRVIIVPALTRVVAGPYRFLNHPNYVVVAAEMVALPLVFGAWRTAIVFTMLNVWMMIVRIGVENHALGKLKTDE